MWILGLKGLSHTKTLEHEGVKHFQATNLFLACTKN